MINKHFQKKKPELLIFKATLFRNIWKCQIVEQKTFSGLQKRHPPLSELQQRKQPHHLLAPLQRLHVIQETMLTVHQPSVAVYQSTIILKFLTFLLSRKTLMLSHWTMMGRLKNVDIISNFMEIVFCFCLVFVIVIFAANITPLSSREPWYALALSPLKLKATLPIPAVPKKT